jgi:polysaccharide biosynthesis protein PslG
VDVKPRGRSTRTQRLAGLLLTRYSITAVMIVAAVATIVMPDMSAQRASSSAAAQHPLPWRQPAIQISAPDPTRLSASDFGADVVNYDDPQWGADSDASLPAVSLGIVRIWDDGSTWARLEPSPGQWNFTDLDRQVAQARSEGAEVLYVLGQTPTWASSDPYVSDIYGKGAPAMPNDLQDWQQYVSTIANRYKGRIGAYEVWDEADASTFLGTPEQMVQLATIAYRTIKAIDPGATVLTPSFTQTSLTDGWLARYLAAGGAKVADAFAGHAYPNDPWGAAQYLLGYREALRSAGSDLPIWMTEVGYSGYTSAGQPLFTSREARTLVAQTIMYLAELGASRSIWYGANTNDMWLSLGEQGYPHDGNAYKTMTGWLAGSVPDGCGNIMSGSYSGLAACYITRAGGAVDELVFDLNGNLTMQAPAKGSYTATTLWGRQIGLRPGSMLSVSESPILISQAS